MAGTLPPVRLLTVIFVGVFAAPAQAQAPPTFKNTKTALESLPCSNPSNDAGPKPPKGVTPQPFFGWCSSKGTPHGMYRRFRMVGGVWHISSQGEYRMGKPTGTWTRWSDAGQALQVVQYLADMQPYQQRVKASGRSPALVQSVLVTRGPVTEEQLCPHRRAPIKPETGALDGCRIYGLATDERGRTTFKAPKQQAFRCESGQDLVVSESTDTFNTPVGIVTVERMMCADQGARIGPYRGFTADSRFTESQIDGQYDSQGRPDGRWSGQTPYPWTLVLKDGTVVEASGIANGTKWRVQARADGRGQEMTLSRSGVSTLAVGSAKMQGGLLESFQLSRTGKWTTNHPNGQTESEGVYTDNLRQGPWTFYKTNGQPDAKGWFVDDRRDGEWILWDLDGEQRSVSYIDGVSNEDRALEELSEFLPEVVKVVTDERNNGTFTSKSRLPAGLCMNLKLLYADVGDYPFLLAATRRCEDKFPHDARLDDACRELFITRCFRTYAPPEKKK